MPCLPMQCLLFQCLPVQCLPHERLFKTAARRDKQARKALPAAGRKLSLLALSAIMLTGPRPCPAQAILNADYLATLSGLPIGKGSAALEITDDRYSMTVSGATAGLMRLFASGHGSASVRGTLIDGVPASAQFNARITSAKKTEDYRLTIADGEVKDYSITPPPPPSDRVPLIDTHRRGVHDPMTATLILAPGGGSPTAPEACQRTLSVFDGRMRYDVQLSFKRRDVIHADSGYSGPAAVCMATFVPIAGHNPDRPALRYLMKLREIEAWLVPITGTRLMAPAKVVIPTPFGLGVLQAVRFDAITQRAATKPKIP